ncbi:hypothetical protein [Natronorubrum texcoconense]|uniref:Uncharacterized protein n=1 Tax=Natronorubrum texcoconense TaxID=1095776 RepID=A0A1G9G1D4_9EURY|nr:hypothetical protein [Natronorubrum texcoconense]SDK94450.1 hypothetical protein SAMN04515672_4379 [Natronorubrum texcoconense]
MADAAEVVSLLFSIIIAVTVVVLFHEATQGGDISGMVQVISELAVPFVLILLFVFMAVALINSAKEL